MKSFLIEDPNIFQNSRKKRTYIQKIITRKKFSKITFGFFLLFILILIGIIIFLSFQKKNLTKENIALLNKYQYISEELFQITQNQNEEVYQLKEELKNCKKELDELDNPDIENY